MTWDKIQVTIDGVGGAWHFYSELPVEVGDKVVVQTARGNVIGVVTEISGTLTNDPFDTNSKHQAKRHVLENVTKNIVNEKECTIMFGTKIVEVKRANANSKDFYFTDLDLKVGDTVVYEALYDGPHYCDSQVGCGMHVGKVVDTEPMAQTGSGWIVDVVDIKAHTERQQRIKKAESLHTQLEQAKSQFQDLQILELIAASNPKVKATLDEYKMLLGGTVPETPCNDTVDKVTASEI